MRPVARLQTPFKGARHYIQGGDVFNSLEAAFRSRLGQSAFLRSLQFHAFPYHYCDVFILGPASDAVNGTLLDQEAAGTRRKVGSATIATQDGSVVALELIESDEAPDERFPYDEESMVARARYADRSATLDAPLEFSSIEVVIALTKALNYKLRPPNEGKWVFGRIDLMQALPAIGKEITITCVKSIPGRFTVNSISIDGRQCGTMQFVAGQP